MKPQPTLSREFLLDALRTVPGPDGHGDIVALGMVSDIKISSAGEATVIIAVDPAIGPRLEPLRQLAEATVKAVPGIKKSTAILTAETTESINQRPDPHDPHGMNKNPRLDLPIRRIIAVASGKGGVGKSTVAANLAVSLARQGFKTGLLDADIYGPSQPLMMGLEGKKPAQESGALIPLSAHGVKIMSIGFMIDANAPLIWRGPMVQSAIYQMLRDVRWGTPEDMLDILVVDMPPGTGDAQLTMAQKVPLAGAVIVSTPQDIALLDARKAIGMFRKVDVPVLGIVENMSLYTCTNCGHEAHIFGHGGAKAEAGKLGCAFLGEIPLSLGIRESGDSGMPVSATRGNGPDTDVFSAIAQQIAEALKLSL